MIPAHDMVGAGSTVYLGFPIWWMAPVWLVNDSVKSNDFAGKTIIPFCTSASSDIGNSASTLQKMAGSGTWLTGHRFSESVSEKDCTVIHVPMATIFCSVDRLLPISATLAAKSTLIILPSQSLGLTVWVTGTTSSIS